MNWIVGFALIGSTWLLAALSVSRVFALTDGSWWALGGLLLFGCSGSIAAVVAA